MKENISKLNNQLCLGGIPVFDLKNKYGTPLYVYETEKINEIIDAYKNSLAENYGEGLICYASKAFSCKEIYRLINKKGIGADFVSGGEIYTALKAGFNFKKGVFHGNNKSYDELLLAVKNKMFLIVIDSLNEAKMLNEICSKLHVIQNVLIRTNVGIEAHTHHYISTAKIDSKFGFSIDNGDATSAIKEINSYKNLVLRGLHSHIGSQIFDKKSFILATEKLLTFYKSIEKITKNSFDILNLGGGFGINYNDDDPIFTPKTYYDFIKDISNTVKKKTLELSLKNQFLIFEPGRSIVGEAGTTLYTVGNVKTIKDVKNIIAVDGGMFENIRTALYQAKYKIIYANDIKKPNKITYTIAGKCCESGDIIAENVSLPKTNIDDLLAVKSTGAYNYSMASNYNRNLIPAVVFVENGKSKLVVKKQTYKDLIKNDK